MQDVAGKYMQKNFMERSNYFINRTCKVKFAHQSWLEAHKTEPFMEMDQDGFQMNVKGESLEQV